MAATGATWQEIADQLGYRSRQAASQAVKRLGNRTPPETVEQARAMHDNALRLLQRSSFTRYLTAMATTASRCSTPRRSGAPSSSAPSSSVPSRQRRRWWI